jgi:hypothetical protein
MYSPAVELTQEFIERINLLIMLVNLFIVAPTHLEGLHVPSQPRVYPPVIDSITYIYIYINI